LIEDVEPPKTETAFEVALKERLEALNWEDDSMRRVQLTYDAIKHGEVKFVDWNYNNRCLRMIKKKPFVNNDWCRFINMEIKHGEEYLKWMKQCDTPKTNWNPRLFRLGNDISFRNYERSVIKIDV
jgi:hypothetical protein